MRPDGYRLQTELQTDICSRSMWTFRAQRRQPHVRNESGQGRALIDERLEPFAQTTSFPNMRRPPALLERCTTRVRSLRYVSVTTEPQASLTREK